MGTNPSNQIPSESMEMLRLQNGDLIGVPKYGPFHTSSVVIKDSEGNTLIKDHDWKAIFLDGELTEKTPSEICRAIYISKDLPNQDDPTVTINVNIAYRTVGYPHTHYGAAIDEILDYLENDNRPVEWGHLIDVPIKFVPERHKHHAGELYGLGKIILALNKLTEVVGGANLLDNPDNLIYTVQDRRMLQQVFAAHLEIANNSTTTQTQMNALLNMLTEEYGLSTIGNYIPGRVILTSGNMDIPLPNTEEYVFGGVPAIYRIKIEFRNVTEETILKNYFSQTDNIVPGDTVYFNNAPVDPGVYLLKIYAYDTATNARTIINHFELRVRQ